MVKFTRRKQGIVVVVVLLLFCAPRLWADAPLSGQAIMEQSFERDDGRDGSFEIEMVLRDKNGGRRIRHVTIYTKDYGELIKSLVRFVSPPDIAGTTFLSWENEAGDDTQYLYLPALKRARRIVSSQKSISFVNTDYTYEDMQRRRPPKDTHQLLREEEFLGRPCYVIESVPVAKENSQYAKRIVWVDVESFVVLKSEFFDKKGALGKRFSVEQFQKRQGIWTPMKTRMENLKDIHTTMMTVQEASYNQGLGDELFSLRALEEE